MHTHKHTSCTHTSTHGCTCAHMYVRTHAHAHTDARTHTRRQTHTDTTSLVYHENCLQTCSTHSLSLTPHNCHLTPGGCYDYNFQHSFKCTSHSPPLPAPPPSLPPLSLLHSILSSPSQCLLSSLHSAPLLIKTISDHPRSADSAVCFFSLTFWGSTTPSSPFLLTSLTSFHSLPPPLRKQAELVLW